MSHQTVIVVDFGGQYNQLIRLYGLRPAGSIIQAVRLTVSSYSRDVKAQNLSIYAANSKYLYRVCAEMRRDMRCAAAKYISAKMSDTGRAFI